MYNFKIMLERALIGAFLGGLAALKKGVESGNVDWRAVLSAAIAGFIGGAAVDYGIYKTVQRSTKV